ncbi:helix-turn-helix domain-containing protein [Jiangella asiatica]|uniref:Helix-turn-helix transcriptional regulator n=1 Tax=Jiangella asiatica TaxID=2530372 RepID=A0A4R5DGE8_9ACTN|nr:helix-turn-helix domain-containing protein [Jiangella asiatica]TDE10894.1 helix-turn-helix transcriptional regulator [Jiangella asiatica]
MTSHPPDPEPVSRLSGIGLTQAEETVYRAMLDLGPAASGDLARRVGWGEREVLAAVQSLEAAGLAGRTATRPARFTAAPPEVAFEPLLMHRQQELQEVRAEVHRLQHRYRENLLVTSPADALQLVTEPAAIVQRFEQLQLSARSEVMVFDKPPYVGSIEGNIEIELRMLAAGVRYRGLYDQQALAEPAKVRALSELMESGEQARAMAELPMKLAIADRQVAMLPLRVEESTGALLVHASSLLDALCALFETLWNAAATVNLARPGGLDEILGPDEHLLLGLIASGVKDDAIGRQLGVGRRTVQRRITELQQRLGTTTRVGLVVEAAHRGWV